MTNPARPVLSQFLTHDPGVDAALGAAIGDLADATRRMARLVARGSLTGAHGYADSANVQGETQKKLDIIGNDLLLEHLGASGHWAGVASEEMDEAVTTARGAGGGGGFLCLFDPLDGSSNIDVNGGVGTIFSVLDCPRDTHAPGDADFLQPGTAQRAAVFTLHGPATVLVLTTGNGANGFTLDPDSGDYVLTHPDIRLPAGTSEFAVNMANQRHWAAPVQRYIGECLQGVDGPRGKDFNMRYAGAMVADFYRVLLDGGVYLYPRDMRDPDTPGKLRLLYEANPMAFIAEQAGGAASSGDERILAIAPTELHQRCAVFIGSREEVERLDTYHRKGSGPA